MKTGSKLVFNLENLYYHLIMTPDGDIESKRIFGLRENVFFLGLVSLFNDFSSEMMYSVMPAFLTSVLGAPAVFVGFLEGFADALASVLKIYFGWFSDKIGKRKILAVAGYTLSVSTRWFLALVGNFWQVFLLRSIDRVGKGLRDSPRDALISESVGRDELGRSFGYHRTMDTIGATLGPLAAVLILPLIFNDYRLLFKIGFFIGILAIFTFVFVRDVQKPNSETRTKISHPPFSFSLAFYSHEFQVYILAVFVFGLGFMPIALMLLKSQETGLNSFGVPLMYFISNLSFVLFAIPAGKLADRIGEKRVLAGGFFSAILAYLILLIFSGIAGVILGFIVLGIYYAMTDGVERAFASKLVPREKLASGQGFLNAAVGLSSLLSGVVGGIIWTKFGSNYALLYGAIMMIIGLLTFVHLNRHRKRGYN